MSAPLVQPHSYFPDMTLGMGDCAVCGHVAESPVHVRSERTLPLSVSGPSGQLALVLDEAREPRRS